MTEKPRDDEERDDELDDNEEEAEEATDAADADDDSADDADEDDDDAKSANDDSDDDSDSDDDDVDAKAASEDADEEQKATKKKRRKRSKKRTRKKATKKETRPAAAKAVDPPKKPADSGGGSNAMLYALVALVAGAAIGWFGHQAMGGKMGVDAGPDSAAVAPSPSGSGAPTGGPCDQWSTTVCKEAGETAAACQQAKSGAMLMPPSACQAALADMPATMAKVKAARSACEELVKKLCADIGPDTDSCKLVSEKTPSFPPERCQQMMQNYDKVLGELQAMEKKNAPLTPEVAAKQAAGDGPSFGPDDAKVTVVEYSDFECPYCSKAAEVVNKLKKNYANKVRFVFRQFPLPMHKNAPLASEAALAAHAQGKFWEMHDKLFENFRGLNRESIEGFAQEIGLNMEKFKAALDGDVHEKTIEADMALGREIGVSGTPTMIVGTKRVSNPTDYDAVAKLIDSELAAAN